MKPNYFIIPTGFVAHIAKAGGSSLAIAIIRDFHNDGTATCLYALYSNAKYPAGYDPDQKLWQHWLGTHGQTTDAPDGQIYACIREPVDRFRSAMAQLSLTDVDAAIDSIVNNTAIAVPDPHGNILQISIQDNFHFWPQSPYVKGGTKLYQFPAQFDAMCTDCGFTLPMPVKNVHSVKPTLTDSQIIQVQAYYSADVDLYNSILTTGQVYG